LRQRFCLIVPLILLSGCNGSDSHPGSVSKSTFDALTSELDKARQEKDELAKRNQELSGQLNTATATIAGLTSDRDAKLKTITELNNGIDAEESKNRNLQTDYDALKLKHEAALKTGKIGQDGKTGFEKELQDKEAELKISDGKLTTLQGERDLAIADRDRLNKALEELADRACH
jgi:hypothetical protein